MRRKAVIERMTEVAMWTGEPIMSQPLVEICGENRVLIEHHMGIGEYSCDGVTVKVRFGSVRVVGNDLKICMMTAEQLIITGSINTITLLKGKAV